MAKRHPAVGSRHPRVPFSRQEKAERSLSGKIPETESHERACSQRSGRRRARGRGAAVDEAAAAGAGAPPSEEAAGGDPSEALTSGTEPSGGPSLAMSEENSLPASSHYGGGRAGPKRSKPTSRPAPSNRRRTRRAHSAVARACEGAPPHKGARTATRAGLDPTTPGDRTGRSRVGSSAGLRREGMKADPGARWPPRTEGRTSRNSRLS